MFAALQNSPKYQYSSLKLFDFPVASIHMHSNYLTAHNVVLSVLKLTDLLDVEFGSQTLIIGLTFQGKHHCRTSLPDNSKTWTAAIGNITSSSFAFYTHLILIGFSIHLRS